MNLKFDFQNIKAQGSTEYLVLLAVVLIIALVSLALLSFFPGTSLDAKLTQSKTYWSSASPIAIVDWDSRFALDGVPPGYTHVYLRIRNTGNYPIRITKVFTNDKTHTQLLTGNWGPSKPIENVSYLFPGEEKRYGYPNYFPGIPNQGIGNHTFFVFDWAFLGSWSTNCTKEAPYGIASINKFGFEYIEYVEGKEIIKTQIGSAPLMIKCRDNYD
jgi:hypothetical protein